MFPRLYWERGIVENKDEEILVMMNYSCCSNRTIFILSNALVPLETWNASKLVYCGFIIRNKKKYSIIIIIFFFIRNSIEKIWLMTKQNTNHDLLLVRTIKIKFLFSEYKYIACPTSLSKKKNIFMIGFF